MVIPTAAAAAAETPVVPTSLLKLVAGEFAVAIARQWAAPHVSFLTASTPRRHLVCLALSREVDLADRGEQLLCGRLRDVLLIAAPGAPAGLARALQHIGELAWSAVGYRDLLRLLAEPAAAKLLRHLEAIEPSLVARMAALPEGLLRAPALAGQLGGEGVRVLREAYEALSDRDGVEAAEAAILAWSRAPNVKRLAEAVRADLCAEPPAPPLAGRGRLRPLASKAELQDAADRHRNCLAGLVAHAASGMSAFYEWNGDPLVIVQITRDHIWGWRLEQARLAGNAAVPADVAAALTADLEGMGVHVGRGGAELDRAVQTLCGRGFALTEPETMRRALFGHGAPRAPGV